MISKLIVLSKQNMWLHKYLNVIICKSGLKRKHSPAKCIIRKTETGRMEICQNED